MRRLLAGLALAGVFWVAAPGPASATTWSPTVAKCPLCGADNEFDDVMSYGSYIYSWPSKFQLIFWPRIDDNFVRTCLKCSYSRFMWDFEKPVPKEKADAIRAALKDLRLGEGRKRYTEIPMADRLAAAEKIETVYGLDDEAWCEFYRIYAWHLNPNVELPPKDKGGKPAAGEPAKKEPPAKESKGAPEAKPGDVGGPAKGGDGAKGGEAGKGNEPPKAGEDPKNAPPAEPPMTAWRARQKALALAEKLAADPAKAAQRKHFLAVRGAMRHFLGDDDRALADFREASKLAFTHKRGPEHEPKNEDRYLSELLKEYVAKIESERAKKSAPAEGEAPAGKSPDGEAPDGKAPAAPEGGKP